jgi:hypothetical protein
MLLVVLATLPWPAVAQPAQGARQESALEAPGKADSPTPQQAISEAKSPDKAAGPAGTSSLMRMVAGVVVDPNGEPVEGADLYLSDYERYFPEVTGELLPQAQPVRKIPEIINRPFRSLRKARTDAGGRFSMLLAPRPYTPVLLIVAEGFGLGYQRLQFVEDRWQAVDPPSRQSVGDLRIRLPKMVPVRGRLLAPDGTPAEGVVVRTRFIAFRDYRLKVCHCGFDFPEYWPRSARTDAQGWFTLKGIPAGSHVYLNLFHPRFATDSLVVEAGPSDIPKPWRYLRERDDDYAPRRVGPTFSHTLSPPRPLEGVVTAADTGEPLPGVILQFVDSLGYPTPGGEFTRTDGQGRYRFNGYLAKAYTISVCAPPDSGYFNTDAVVQPDPSDGKRVRKDFQLQPGKIIRGRILDAETEEPIRGASVRFFPVLHGVRLEGGKAIFRHTILTDKLGRFAVTGTSGPGVLSVETTDRSYLRWRDVDRIWREKDMSWNWYWTWRARPMTLFSVQVPLEGDLREEVVIRLRRGRTVVLQAVGPKGERLPWVRTCWDGILIAHGDGDDHAGFVDGTVVVPGVDPNSITRVFLWQLPQKLAAVFDITPQTPDGPIEVRLQPMASIAGRIVKPDGDPVGDYRVRLKMSYDPEVSQFRTNRWGPAGRYSLYFASSLDQRTDSDGRFLFQDLVPGVPLGLGYEPSSGPMVTVEPVEPGERRDLGNLIRKGDPPDDTATVLRLVGRIGLVPDLEELRQRQPLKPPKVYVLPGSAAEKAGIRSGDRITALNGRLVEQGKDIEELWERLSWDDALARSIVIDGLRLSLLREGTQVEATLTRDLLPSFFGPDVKPVGDDLFEVTFTYQPKERAEAVYLAGSFNNWKPTAHKMDGPDQQGRYTARLKLKKGRYEYKFVLDGETWQPDPENILQTGSDQKSVLHVGAEH